MRSKLTDKGPHLWYLAELSEWGVRKTVKAIREAGFRAVMIERKTDAIHKRTKRPMVKRWPVLANYVFVRVPRLKPNWNKLLRCKGVRRIMALLGEDGYYRPIPIPRKIVLDMVVKQRRGVFDETEAGAIRRDELKKEKHARLKSIFKKGSTVLVTDGPFASFPGLVEHIRDNGALLIEVSIFGRPTPVELEPGQVELTKPAPEKAA